MVVLGALNAPGVLRLPISTVATASAANIACAVVMRQELVINALFILFGHCPRWFPLRIRRLSAKIYHLGGVHSGAGVAATIWFGLTNVATFSMNPEAASGGTLIALWTITIALDILLLSILLMALPAFRVRWHDCWEWSHRFCGWAAIGLFWALFLLISITAKRTMSPEPHLWRVIVVSPVFWLLVLITICLIAPWLNLRKVPVRSEKLSNHAVRLHFTYANVPLCSAPRLTDKPLREWHAFASIPEESGKGFSVLVSKAGNWTGAIIENPPSYLWKRGWLTRGVLNVAPIFKSMVLVATGSGIGPVLSLLQAKRKLGFIRLLWSTKDPIKTYGQRVMDNVMAADPNAVIINTSVDRRPNLLELAHGMYVDSQAEAVFVISNPRVTRKTVYGLESRGVPTFAPIFDS
ncbi:uncharacterized protein HMPREF1541_10801 [Cyphellophora europaea CBS 101466]|uniref:Integral membrane protein TmpA n=1 Tax=Cyphellophora europaea (strain CBS 101466) TaxID=1220924 RepID=W2S6J3_CYPE1|nr:uncharacterized protein HMPREF1541_10801 [Cyphellophora europaea CBS 101466]ETN44250.1 hypothetical protein HMPREF1541_10801 [Cyphellophora europaea CBS 101466]